MAFPTPDALFAPLAAAIERRLPPHPAWLLPAAAGTGLGAAAVALALHHHWIGAGLLLAGLLAAGLETAETPTLTLGLLALPFGFALADPSRALAAMFLMFALTVLAVLRSGHVSLVTWLVAGVLLAAALFPNRFSLLAYLVGVACFVAAGQGVARRLS